MSGWRLVEAETDEPDLNEQQQGNKFNRGNYGVGRANRGDQMGGRGRGGGRGNRGMISRQERNNRAIMAAKQVELIFSPDNLCMDTYVRSYMDEAGYVPIALVYHYPNVAQFGALYGDLKYRLKQVGEKSHIEVDSFNELVRTKVNWEMWLMPNLYGGRGQPRYVKQSRASMQNMGNQYGYGNQQQQQWYGGNMMQYGDESGMSMAANMDQTFQQEQVEGNGEGYNEGNSEVKDDGNSEVNVEGNGEKNVASEETVIDQNIVNEQQNNPEKEPNAPLTA